MSDQEKHGSVFGAEAVAAVLVLIGAVVLVKRGLAWVLVATGIFTVLLGLARWSVFPGRALPKNRVRYLRARVRLRLYPGRGFATVFGLWLRWGRLAALRGSGRTRRSLSFGERLGAGAAAYSVLLGTGHYRHRLRVSLEEHILVMAPPRSGKSGWLAGVILHYPGPVVSTTTKHDVFELTSGVRARRGPVHVFNPQGIGGVPSTFRWNPLEGCQEPAVAIRRADSFAYAVSMDGVEGGGFWSDKASDYLRACFHAAALADLDLRHVATWILAEDATEAEDILGSFGRDLWAGKLRELRSDAQKTAATVRMTMTRALAFLDDPVLLDSVLPDDGAGLDIAEFLTDSGTLYLIAESSNERAPLAALYACLGGEIHYQACLLGSMTPGGRLDPPLLMALDEVTQICPVPLPHWLADSGGKGIQVVPVVHGEAQLASRWKDHGKQIIEDTCGVKALLPGVSDPNTLEMASRLCGRAAFREHGQDHLSRHPVMDEDMIRELPAGHALVIRGSAAGGGLAPVIARLPMAWKDRTYKRARRAGTAIAALTATPTAAIAEPTLDRARLAPVPAAAAMEPDAEAADPGWWRAIPPAGPVPANRPPSDFGASAAPGRNGHGRNGHGRD